jgi:hypothetical protein
MFTRNFQGTYECPSTIETLKIIKQKHDESLHDYVKHFCNVRNDISYIQNIKIINTFRDGVNDLKTMEEIAMKKLKTVADLLAVADVCIEASETRAKLLESRGKGSSRRRNDREINTTERGDQKDRGGYHYCGKQYSDQKKRRPFWRLDNAEKWCKIHRTDGHDLKECKTFLDHKKMSPPATSAPQDPRRGEHHREVSDGDGHMMEINMIFGGSMSINSKTQGKKLQREIILAQHIEPGRRMKWSDDYITFRPEDHPVTELSERNLSLIVKIPIGRHKVAKTLIDSGASLNLIIRRTFIEMSLNLSDLTPVHDMFYEVIPGQTSIPIGCIDLEVSCRTGENKRREMLTFEVASFDIGYNCILRMSFLLKFMAVIHIAYATVKMPCPRGVITLKSDQCDALAYENTSLTHARRFGKEEVQKLAAKVAKTHGRGTPAKTVTPGPSTGGTSKMFVAKQKQSMTVTPASAQRATDQLVADEKKGVTDKEI